MGCILTSCLIRKDDHSIGQPGKKEAIPPGGFDRIPFVVRPDEDGRLLESPGCDRAQQVIMRMVNIQNVELLSPQKSGQVVNIPKGVQKGGGVRKLQDMVEMKLTGRLDPRFQDPLFKTVFNLKRGFPIG
jgi:hypothetical protein